MMVVQLLRSEAHAACGIQRRAAHTRRRRTGQMVRVRLRGSHCLAVIHLRHAAHTPTPQTRVLVAVSPAVDGALDQTALAAQTRIELCQRPSDGVAFGLVHETVPAVLVLGTAGARVDAVLGLEFLGQGLNVDVLDVAADGVFHLDAVARVFKGDPLDAVVVLADDKRCGGRDGAGSSGCVCGIGGGVAAVGGQGRCGWESRAHGCPLRRRRQRLVLLMRVLLLLMLLLVLLLLLLVVCVLRVPVLVCPRTAGDGAGMRLRQRLVMLRLQRRGRRRRPDEQRLGGELRVLGGGRMLCVVGGVDGVHGRVLRVGVHGLRQLRRLMAVERAAMLVVSLRRRDRGG